MINNGTFTGRLVKDVELRYTNTGKAVTRGAIAVESGYGDNKKVLYPQIVFWGVQAEYVYKYAKKGTMIAVQVRYDESSYTNKDGKTVKVKEFVCENVQVMIGNFTESSTATSISSASEPTDDLGFSEITDEDIPF